MKHSIEELYNIEGMKGLYSEDYLDKYFVQVETWSRNFPHWHEGWAHKASNRSNAGTLNVHTANGIKVVYTVGEYTWYDTEEERDAVRAQNQKKKEENARRREALAKLEKLSTANLEKLVAKLGL